MKQGAQLLVVVQIAVKIVWDVDDVYAFFLNYLFRNTNGSPGKLKFYFLQLLLF